MKKKIIYIMPIILLLTGCKVEYKINLDTNLNIEENINLIATSDSDKTKINDFSLNIPIDKEIDDYGAYEEKIADIEYYNKTKTAESLTFNYKYDNEKHDEYINSNLANMAYEYISISTVDEDTKVLSTSKEFLLFDKYDNLEEVKVTINTTYKVLSNNADEVNKHNYTWIITKDNAYGKGIYLKVDTSKEDLTFYEKLIRGDYLNMFTLSLVILFIGFIIYTLVKRRDKKINKV